MKLIRILSRKRKSFTLVELIITIIVVGIIAVPISLTVVQHMEAVMQSSQQTLTLNLARLEIERLSNMAYDDLPSGTTTLLNYEGYQFDVKTVINKVSTGPEGLATIIVSVLRAGTSDVVEQLITYRTRNISYGT